MIGCFTRHHKIPSKGLWFSPVSNSDTIPDPDDMASLQIIYEIAKRTSIHLNTVKRFEEGEYGVTFKDGFRYFMFAESHKSKSSILKKFREAMAAYQTEQDKVEVVNAIRK